MNLASSIFNLSGSSLPLLRGSNSMYSASVQGLDSSTLMSRNLCSNSFSRTTAKLVQSDEVWTIPSSKDSESKHSSFLQLAVSRSCSTLRSIGAERKYRGGNVT
jgi:hypothetical protein